jgi:hypothetical protein
MSYKLNIISPIPREFSETVMPPSVGDVEAFAAYTICADTTPLLSTFLAEVGSDQLFPRESVTLVANGPAALNKPTSKLPVEGNCMTIGFERF